MVGSSSLRSSTFGSRLSQSGKSVPEFPPFDASGSTIAARKRWFNCCNRENSTSVLWFRRCIRSRIWKLCSIFFGLFLLFGSPIQHLWVPPSGDMVFNVLSSVTFAFFIIDIAIRICVEPNYFNFNWCCCSPPYSEQNYTCVVGSFMFWCDLLSTGAVLYEIPLITSKHYETMDVQIRLDDGLPVRKKLSQIYYGFVGGSFAS